MPELSLYVFESLWEDGEFVLSRSVRDTGLRPLLAVTAAAAHPLPSSLGRLEHELGLRDDLDPVWCARPRALEIYLGRPTLILDDPGGDLLARLLGSPWDVAPFLRVAIGLAAALGRLHQRGLVHKDVKPANVLADVASGCAWLTGFGIASRLPSERQAPASPEVIAGTFAYMAPEQTGRMNRSIDARSDLYSLGVTLYEMLTGELPFTASEPIEWIHCHVARRPLPPSERVGGVSRPLEAIVLKLLAKTAEDRYQTAAGVETDLRRCLGEWEAHGHVDPFPLGAHDASERLLIQEKLYGREAEIGTLVAAFERVVNHGATELVLVSGYSGVGKSSVVNELHKVLVAPRGLFAAGKFEQYKRDIPYATLAQAFQGLVRELLSKVDAEVGQWRRALLDALGPNGELMVNLIPELALIIGESAPVPALPPQDAANRFQLVFRRFLGVFAQAEHPLALFLDDLQWLDTSTMDLIEHLVTHPDVRHLLLVGAYRDNEVGPSHPLIQTLAAIRGAGRRVQETVLAPLTPDDVGRLVADSLHCDRETARPLAQLVHEKTAGNPFFAIQFLMALTEEALLAFDYGAAAWRWDLPRIGAKGFTDNVVDLMAAKLGRLPDETQDALGQLACLGNVGEIATLALLRGGSEDEIAAGLWEALRAGLVFRRDAAYAFVHDRVQEAAYALIPDGERAAAHLRIGRVLASRLAREKLEETIFDVANHLNRGEALISTEEERAQVAELNLMAGERAKSSTAYASALSYLIAGRALVTESGWEHRYPLVFALELERAECEFLTGDDEAEQRLSMLAGRARNLIDLAAVASLRQVLYTTLDRLDRSVEVALDYLGKVGVHWTPHPTQEEVLGEYEQLWGRLDSRSIEHIADLPRMTDPECCATVDVLTEFVPAAYFTDINLLCLVVCRITNLSLDHGNSNGSVYAYSLLGFLLRTRFSKDGAGFRFGKLALALTGERGLDRFRARVYLNFAYCVNPWTNHIRTGRTLLRRGLTAAQETGDLTFGAYLYYCLITDLLASGDPLEVAQREAETGLEFASKARFGLVVDILTGHLRLIRALRGMTGDLGSFNDAEFDEGSFERHLETDPRLANPTCVYWIRKLQARFFAGDYAAAVTAAAKAEPLLWTSPASFEMADYHFYSGLARAAHHDSAPADDRRCDLQALAAHHHQIEAWAANCADNFDNRAALLAAEIARIEGRDLEAMHLYDRAIGSAREHGFVQNEGLGDELAARFYAARGFDTNADAYLRKARACYLRWGADGKVRQLEQAHPHLRQEAAPRSTSMAGTPLEHLDLRTVVKVSQTVSAEIDLEKLIANLMRTALEHAGAARGLLILSRRNELTIEAEGTTVRDAVEVRLRQARVAPKELPESILRHVIRTGDSLLLDDASEQNPFSGDEYIRQNHSRSILCLPLIKQAKLIAMLYLENNLAPGVFTPDRIAVLKLLASQAAISMENARLYTDLEQAKAYLSEAQRLSQTGSFGWNVSSGEIIWSAETFRIFEIDGATTPTLERIYERVHPDDLSRVRQFIDRRSSDVENDWELEHRLLVPEGSVKDLRVVAHRLRHESGDVEFVGAVMDVTAARQSQKRLETSLEEKKALLKEVHHRVKNNLQLISSLLSLQASRIADRAVAELFADSRNRVRSMALVHENLYRAGNYARIPMSSHVQKLCAHLTHAYGMRSQGVELAVRVKEMDLDLEQAVSCGLIINEVVSNALKHAFPDGRSGRVSIELNRQDNRRVVLTVRDDGVGLPPGFDVSQVDTLGLQLVRDLIDQLHGTVQVSSDSGTVFTFAFDENRQAEPRG
jgi:predicted ATPase/two-component sensor histidine kinase/GAF domain-containing protein